MYKYIIYYFKIIFVNTLIIAVTFVSSLVLKNSFGDVFAFVFYPFVLILTGVFLFYFDVLNSFFKQIVILFIILFSSYNIFVLSLSSLIEMNDITRIIFLIMNLIIFLLGLNKTRKQELRDLIFIIILTIYNLINIPCSNFSPNTLLINYFLYHS